MDFATPSLANSGAAVEIEGPKLGSNQFNSSCVVGDRWSVGLRDSFFCRRGIPHRESDGCIWSNRGGLFGNYIIDGDLFRSGGGGDHIFVNLESFDWCLSNGG